MSKMLFAAAIAVCAMAVPATASPTLTRPGGAKFHHLLYFKWLEPLPEQYRMRSEKPSDSAFERGRVSNWT